jgi:TolB-like protein/Tfp pilus assembly protein PilF
MGQPESDAATQQALLQAPNTAVTDPVQPDRTPASRADSIWERIKRHKVVEWTLAYVAFAYALLHGVEIVGHAFEWPLAVPRFTVFLLLLGIPVAATLAYYHGHRAQHRVSRIEISILAALLVIAGSVLWFLSRSNHEPAVASATASAPTTATSAPAFSPPAHSVAVLPFVNMSGDASQEYFSDGLSEELIDVLTKIPELRVPARTSSFYFKGKQTTIAEVAKVLGVANVLEGSVRKAGNKLRVTAQLIQADNGYDLWSETYDHKVDDVFKIQDEIAGAIAQVMRIQLLSNSPSPHVTPTTEAHDLYLQGLYVGNRNNNREGIKEALVYFRKAVDADPNYAEAWAALAIATGSAVGNVENLTPQVANRQVREAATRALQLDPSLPKAHRAMFDVYANDLQWDLAEREANTALRLDPGDSANLNLVSLAALWIHANLDDATRLMEQAVARDPVNVVAGTNLCQWYRIAGRLDQAEHQCRTLSEVRPDSQMTFFELGLMRLDKGQLSAARAEFANATDPEFRLVGDVILNYKAGHRSESDAALEALSRQFAADPTTIAWAHAYRGEVDQAFDWLERGFPDVEDVLSALRTSAFATFKQHPRYVALLKRLRLQQ